MAERDNKKWGVADTLVRDIGIVFATTTALVAVLDLTLPTWNRIKLQQGVKKNTALNVVKRYFELLRQFGDGNEIPEDSYETYGRDMLAKYRDDIESHRFEKFVRPFPQARKPAQKAAKT